MLQGGRGGASPGSTRGIAHQRGRRKVCGYGELVLLSRVSVWDGVAHIRFEYGVNPKGCVQDDG